MMFKKAGILSWCVLLASILSGCSSTTVSSKSQSALDITKQAVLCGRLEYEGSNFDYVPLIFNQDNEIPSEDVRFLYRYEVKYDVDMDTVFELFNPFLILGIPKSTDVILVSGQIDVLGPQNFTKTYLNSINLVKKDSIFSDGDTLSEIRKAGLIALRNSFDEMMLADLPIFKDRRITCTTYDKEHI